MSALCHTLGSITQSVWNALFHQTPGYSISDVDIVYYDPDLSVAKEAATQEKIAQQLAGNQYTIDVKNEARVHLWYAQRFGKTITPYQSTEDAISTWPTTATALGVYIDENARLQAFAPYGLNDLFMGIVRPNKKLITAAVYQAKAHKWQQKWPDLTVVDW
ncbi:nucleotidyltransferase family protein [Loigolactobacillus coryniformis subsp. coryniformis]|uniref:nucleotidyltransferase family protein n=1 Tax=Loigolactobacillus coryniformis TaxID=1610 RepID=UPI003995B4D1